MSSWLTTSMFPGNEEPRGLELGTSNIADWPIAVDIYNSVMIQNVGSSFCIHIQICINRFIFAQLIKDKIFQITPPAWYISRRKKPIIVTIYMPNGICVYKILSDHFESLHFIYLLFYVVRYNKKCKRLLRKIDSTNSIHHHLGLRPTTDQIPSKKT